MALIIINGNDISARIASGSYQINESDVYASWTDANGIPHRDVLRQSVSGSFDILFRTKKEYDEFVSHIEESKQPGGYCLCLVAVNNTNKMVRGNFFIDFAPKRSIKKNGIHMMDMFAVKISERNRYA